MPRFQSCWDMGPCFSFWRGKSWRDKRYNFRVKKNVLSPYLKYLVDDVFRRGFMISLSTQDLQNFDRLMKSIWKDDFSRVYFMTNLKDDLECALKFMDVHPPKFERVVFGFWWLKIDKSDFCLCHPCKSIVHKSVTQSELVYSFSRDQLGLHENTIVSKSKQWLHKSWDDLSILYCLTTCTAKKVYPSIYVQPYFFISINFETSLCV